jgi:hypothetical protein
MACRSSRVEAAINLDNLVQRVIIPAIEKCVVCRKSEVGHKPEGHTFKLDESLQ